MAQAGGTRGVAGPWPPPAVSGVALGESPGARLRHRRIAAQFPIRPARSPPRSRRSSRPKLPKSQESPREREAAKIVVRLPVSLSGEDSGQTALTRSFADELGDAVEVPV